MITVSTHYTIVLTADACIHLTIYHIIITSTKQQHNKTTYI